jgi:hypothetical protein
LPRPVTLGAETKEIDCHMKRDLCSRLARVRVVELQTSFRSMRQG